MVASTPIKRLKYKIRGYPRVSNAGMGDMCWSLKRKQRRVARPVAGGRAVREQKPNFRISRIARLRIGGRDCFEQGYCSDIIAKRR